MKMGMRSPSPRRSITARTTGKVTRKVKSSVNPMYGKKGMGMINDPSKSVYNKVYNKTTKGINDLYDSDSSSENVQYEETEAAELPFDTTILENVLVFFYVVLKTIPLILIGALFFCMKLYKLFFICLGIFACIIFFSFKIKNHYSK